MIETYASSAALADAAALAIGAALAGGLEARGKASLVATGGRSPGAVYDRLAQTPIDWPQVAVTLSDERCVDPEAPEANARLVRERLLVGAASCAPFLPLWPAPDPADLAALAPFDAVMLGMGEDGHIASMIPGDPGLEAAFTTVERLAHVPAGLGKPPVARITMTLSAFTSAHAIFLLIAGAAKREVSARALAGEDLPVARLLATSATPVRIFWSLEAP